MLTGWVFIWHDPTALWPICFTIPGGVMIGLGAHDFIKKRWNKDE